MVGGVIMTVRHIGESGLSIRNVSSSILPDLACHGPISWCRRRETLAFRLSEADQSGRRAKGSIP
jgi:hypothetical protein